MHWLPIELLMKIFRNYIDISSHPREGLHKHREALMLVCRPWKLVLENCQTAWSKICVEAAAMRSTSSLTEGR